MGAERGTNQTGELTSVIKALLFLLYNIEMGLLEVMKECHGVVILVDSLYAMNQIEGNWKMGTNKDLIETGQKLLELARRSWDVTFVHVKGHRDDDGNERADELVQWGKTAGPYSRFKAGGGGEGDGRYGALVGRIRSAKRPLILPNGYIGEHIVKELVLGEEQSTTESEPDGSEESDSEESEMRSGEENGLEDQTASVANPNSLSHAHTHGLTNALGESREDSLSLEVE